MKKETSRAKEVRRKAREYLLGMMTYYEEPLVIERGQGATVVDIEGREYLDFFAGIVTVGLGHCHQAVTERTVEQARTLQHASTLYLTEPLVDMGERLAEITPGRLKKSFFTSSGTEANETAVLLARSHTERNEILALRQGYTGRSSLAMGLAGQSAWRLPGSDVAGIVHAPGPYCYRCPYEKTYPSCDLVCARDLEDVIQTSTSGKIAAFLAEPIQGLGGFITPPKEYFQIAVEIVRKYGGVFICDEVQTGFGRTGTKMFGIEHYGVEPEIMTVAKSLANGTPVGATIAVPEVADSLKGFTISTFGGNAVSMAAAGATLDVIIGEDLAQNAQEIGVYFREHLEGLKEKYPLIGDVRGMGLIQAIELVEDGKRPAPEATNRLFEETKKRGLLIGRGGIYRNVIRFTPPINIHKADVDQAIQILDASLDAVQTQQK